MDNEMLITRLASSLQKYPRKGAILILKQRKDISSLSRIMNDFEKWINDYYYGKDLYSKGSDVIGCKDVIDKLQELKDSDKE